MINFDGEKYCNVKEAADYLNIQRCMFYNNVRGKIQAYQVGARRRRLYKVTDLEPFRNIQPVKVAASV